MIAVLLITGAVLLLWPTRLSIRPARDRLSLAALRNRLTTQDPRRLILGLVTLVAALGLLLGGPVAAVVGAVYTALGGRALLRRSARRRTATERSAALDDLAALAADLRAGLVTASPAADPVGGRGAELGAWTAADSTGVRGVELTAWAVADPAGGRGAQLTAPAVAGSAGGWSAKPAASDKADPAVAGIAALTASVWRLADQTGAPAADLVERIEADARAADRATASAAAQAAGAQATAMLLAGLPLGGIGLGIAIGADPVRVLLHTPLGAACAIAAVLLQGAGLLWAERLAR